MHKPPQSSYWTLDRQKLLAEVYPTASVTDYKKYFPEKTKGAIQQYARLHGLKKTVCNMRKGDLTPLLNETPESYYWIGYIFADGYIHIPSEQLMLGSDLKDLDQMQKFATFIRCEAKIYDQKKSGFRSKSGKQVRVSVRHADVCNKIVQKFDFKFQKTYNPPNPEFIEKVLDTKEKFTAFMAGLIDGDGWINKKQACIKIECHPAWADFYRKINDLFSRFYNFHMSPITFSKRGYVSWHLFRIEQNNIFKNEVKKLLSTVILERKWN